MDKKKSASSSDDDASSVSDVSIGDEEEIVDESSDASGDASGEEDTETPSTKTAKNASAKLDAREVDYVAVAPHLRRTTMQMTIYERAHCISMRALAIDDGGIPMIDVTGYGNSREIAEAELNARRSPLLIKRSVGVLNGIEYFEFFSPNEMGHPKL